MDIVIILFCGILFNTTLFELLYCTKRHISLDFRKIQRMLQFVTFILMTFYSESRMAYILAALTIGISIAINEVVVRIFEN